MYPTVPEYILLNCAYLRQRLGHGPEQKDATLEEIDAGMPSAMHIHYVRVYSGTPDP